MVKQYFTIWSYKNLLHRITVNKSFSPCFHVQVSQKLSMSVLALIQLDWTGEFPTASNKTVDKKNSPPLVYDACLCISICQLCKTVKDKIQLYSMVIGYIMYINYTNSDITTFLVFHL